MEAGWKTFAVVLQHCSEAECLCIDLVERENREIFHMFISRTPPDKQPSPGPVSSAAQGSASAGYKNPSVSRRDSIIVAKAQSWKDSSGALSLFVLLSASFVYLSNLYKMFLSSSPLSTASPQMQQMKYVLERFFNILKPHRRPGRDLISDLKCPKMLNVHKRMHIRFDE